MIFCLCLFLLLVSAQQYDVVVYGSTPAGIAAAISAARTSTSRVALLEPTAHIGGMSVAGGIGLRDLGVEGTLGGVGWEWIQLNSKHYGVSYPVYQPDMDIAEANFLKLLSDPAHPVDLFYNVPLREKQPVKKQGTTILSIWTQNLTFTKEWTAKVFIDASYEGDLARFAGASYTYGRESKAEYNEPYAGVRAAYTSWGNFLESYPTPATFDNGTLLPYLVRGPLLSEGSADKSLQGFSFRLCITDNKENQVPFPRPPGYNPADFVLTQKYIETLVASKYPDGPPFGFMVDVLDYRGYPKHNKWDMCDSQSAFTSDVINLAHGYVEGTYLQRKAISAKHYYYVAGLLTFLSTDPSVPKATRDSTNRFGMCKDQWPENNHWPPQIYVREGLRIVGDRVFTQNDLVSASKLRRNDTIGLGSWVIDIHVVQRVAVESKEGKLIADNEGQMFTGIDGSTPYELPYSLLLPKRAELTNLLVPVCSSSSHVAFCSLRVEPTYIQLGQASGNAAALAAKHGVAVQDVPIAELQSALLAQGIKLHW